MIGEGEQLNPEEFSNLILDELSIESLTAEDKKFLEEFTNLELLAMNQTSLRSTANFPEAANMTRLELNDNKLAGSELKNLAKYGSITTLKFANNLIKEMSDLNALEGLENLVNLDLTGNPVTEQVNYKKKVFEMFPNLEVLDAQDKEGNEVLSEEDEDYDDEDGEGDGDDEFIDMDQLDPEVRKKLEEQGLPLDGEEEEYGDEDYDEEEEGDEEDEEAEGNGNGNLGKRGHDDEEEEDEEEGDEEPAAKRKK